MRGHRGGPGDDRRGARARPQGDARLPRRRDERRDRSGGTSRAGGRVGGPRRQPAGQRRSLSRGRRGARPLRVSGSAGAGRHRRVSAHRVDVAVFSVALAVVGLVTLALVWSGDWAYALLARTTGNTETTIGLDVPAGSLVREMSVDLVFLLQWHHGWAGYVTGVSAEPPRFGGQVFTPEEYAHMADGRSG